MTLTPSCLKSVLGYHRDHHNLVLVMTDYLDIARYLPSTLHSLGPTLQVECDFWAQLTCFEHEWVENIKRYLLDPQSICLIHHLEFIPQGLYELLLPTLEQVMHSKEHGLNILLYYQIPSHHQWYARPTPVRLHPFIHSPIYGFADD